MPVQIGAKAHPFSDPTGLLSDCHRRIEMFLRALEGVASVIDRPLTEETRAALKSALRYFREGLRAAQMSVKESIRVNMTLCFSQAQAAAVYAATEGSKESVYVSPFVGRLDDRGDDGMDLVRNIKKMYEHSDGHVHVLAASIRTVNQLLCSFALSAELATVPTKVLEEWAARDFPMPDQDFRYQGVDAGGKPLKAIPYKGLDLDLPWQSFDIAHELTTKGIQKFVADYQSTRRRPA